MNHPGVERQGFWPNDTIRGQKRQAGGQRDSIWPAACLIARHATARLCSVQVGERDGYGRFGVLMETSQGLLCHECGLSFVHLGLQ